MFIVGETVMSVNSELDGKICLYNNAFDKQANYKIYLKPYEKCIIISEAKKYKRRLLQIKTISGIGWIHPSSLKRA